MERIINTTQRMMSPLIKPIFHLKLKALTSLLLRNLFCRLDVRLEPCSVLDNAIKLQGKNSVMTYFQTVIYLDDEKVKELHMFCWVFFQISFYDCLIKVV